jgi:hypothetical protein
MNASVKVAEMQGNWLFMTPVANLVLDKAVNREMRIDRVLFLHPDRLCRIRKRLGIGSRILELNDFWKSRLQAGDSIAVVRHSGRPRDLKARCLRLVRDELAILASSQLGYAKRRFAGHVGLAGEFQVGRVSYVFLNRENRAATGGGTLTTPPHVMKLNDKWKAWQRKFFFCNLLRIIQKRVDVAKTWRETLRRAAILVGKSLNTNDLPAAFLWNMIALESLLTVQGDKYVDAIPERLEAFLGWVGFWDTRRFDERIREAYQVRCKLVHDGDMDKVTKELLLFTDDLVLNVFVNLTKHVSIFSSKASVVAFADRVQAEHLLGIKSKARPKSLVMVSPEYTATDYADM